MLHQWLLREDWPSRSAGCNKPGCAAEAAARLPRGVLQKSRKGRAQGLGAAPNIGDMRSERPLQKEGGQRALQDHTWHCGHRNPASGPAAPGQASGPLKWANPFPKPWCSCVRPPVSAILTLARVPAITASFLSLPSQLRCAARLRSSRTPALPRYSPAVSHFVAERQKALSRL